MYSIYRSAATFYVSNCTTEGSTLPSSPDRQQHNPLPRSLSLAPRLSVVPYASSCPLHSPCAGRRGDAVGAAADDGARATRRTVCKWPPSCSRGRGQQARAPMPSSTPRRTHTLLPLPGAWSWWGAGWTGRHGSSGKRP